MPSDYMLHFDTDLYIGNEKLLDNKLRYTFTALLNRIEDSSPTDHEAFDILQNELLSYLKNLNNIKDLPLQFRIHTLKSLHHSHVLHDELISCMLMSYRVAVELIMRETGRSPRYFSDILGLSVDALNLSVVKLKRTLTKHHAPATEDIRCVFHIARLAMRVLPDIQKVNVDSAGKFLLTFTWHELIRRLDFFSKERKSQVVLIQELERYIEHIHPVLYLKGKKFSTHRERMIFLQVFPDQPDHLSEIVTGILGVAKRDTILFSLNDFLDAVSQEKRKAQAALKKKDHDFASQERESLLDVTMGAEMILKSLLLRLRHGMRRKVEDTQVILQLDAARAMAQSRSSYHDDHRIESIREEEKTNSWDVLNYSVRGARLCSHVDTVLPNDLKLGALVGMRWIGEVAGQVLGFIRWYKFQNNHYYIGIEFLGLACQLRKAVTMQRTWIVLQEVKAPDKVWFPDYWVEEGVAFIMPIDAQQSVHCYVDKIIQRGPNYSCCKVVRATESTEVDDEETGSFDIEEIYL